MQRPNRTSDPEDLMGLRNIGVAMRADFALLGIDTVSKLARQNEDDLYMRLSALTGMAHDPCVHDTFAAAIHQAKTGEALAWWEFTPARKAKQKAGTFLRPRP